MFEIKVEPLIALGFNLDFRKVGLKLSLLYNNYYKKYSNKQCWQENNLKAGYIEGWHKLYYNKRQYANKQ